MNMLSGQLQHIRCFYYVTPTLTAPNLCPIATPHHDARHMRRDTIIIIYYAAKLFAMAISE